MVANSLLYHPIGSFAQPALGCLPSATPGSICPANYESQASVAPERKASPQVHEGSIFPWAASPTPEKWVLSDYCGMVTHCRQFFPVSQKKISSEPHQHDSWNFLSLGGLWLHPFQWGQGLSPSQGMGFLQICTSPGCSASALVLLSALYICHRCILFSICFCPLWLIPYYG